MKKQADLSDIEHHEKYLSTTYGSRYMSEPVPKYELPQNGLPASVAYQILHDEIVLDGKPAQNLASFVTTWMEPEAEKLILEGLHFNLADEDEYPHVIKIQERCINMLARLFNAPEGSAVGTSTIGSSEAMMLAGLAMKWRWRSRRMKEGKPTDQPNLVMGENVQVCWEKFARYFDVTPKLIPLEKGQYTITPEKIVEQIDENTIGVCAILGSTFTGEFEPIEAIHDAVVQSNQQTGWDVPVHVDAASGGFVAPFLYPDLPWDFRLPNVCSMNISGHKYGLVYPGVGWVIWRDQESLPEDLVFHVNYLGGDMPTFNLNFSRPASHIIAQYYNFLRMGFSGYRDLMRNLKSASDYLADQFSKIEDFEIISDHNSLPLVAWTIRDHVGYDAFQLSEKLRETGWIVPAYTMPKNAQDIAALRVVVREGFSRDMADNLVEDMHRAVAFLREHSHVVQPTRTEEKPVKVC